MIAHSGRRRVRCAIYTRKSTEDGLDQDFNSLDAQREACAAYVASQAGEGWELISDRFDDGGVSGGTLDRPALQRLLQAIEARQVDQIVVYKIDRLTRSLSDFSKLVDRLDAVGASFVSVTQAFNTATSMGRLTLNMLLSFAQFERVVTAERIRDKIAASKRKGLWMGGTVPLGYTAEGRSLIRDPKTAPTVVTLYELYPQFQTLTATTTAAAERGLKTRKGLPLGRSHIHSILTNPIYAGRIKHHDKTYPGTHEALIDPDHWTHIQSLLQQDAQRDRGVSGKHPKAPLCGKLLDETGRALTPTHTSRSGRRIGYYVSRADVDKDDPKRQAWRLPAAAIEAQLTTAIQDRLLEPSCVSELCNGTSAHDVLTVTTALAERAASLKGRPAEDTLALVKQARLGPGRIAVTLDAAMLASGTCADLDLTWHIPMTLKRRGVELRLILGNQSAQLDLVLIQNIKTARDWYGMMRQGKTFADIIAETGTNKNRLRTLLPLAFLAPDLLRQITRGEQPTGFTSEWLKTNILPTAWPAQRDLFSQL